jgi:hypothetical protein
LTARGEKGEPLERLLRDFRINRIFEGSTEIMELFIAREAVDTHLKVAGALADPRSSMGAKHGAFVKTALFYAAWYPTRWLGWSFWPKYAEFGKLAKHMRYADRTSRRLARGLFYCIVRFGPKLEKRQAVLARLVEVGAELFAITATCSRAQSMVKAGDASARSAVDLADTFCHTSRRKVSEKFRHLFFNDDVAVYKTAQRVLANEYTWLEEGVVKS